ncbi:MAG: hypothetical protein ABIW33_04450, partial [Sphingomicrobium sp.]
MGRVFLLAGALMFALPTAVQAQRAGTLISATPTPGAPAGMRAWSIHYWSMGENGQLQDLTGIVAAPDTGQSSPTRPVLAWT